MSSGRDVCTAVKIFLGLLGCFICWPSDEVLSWELGLYSWRPAFCYHVIAPFSQSLCGLVVGQAGGWLTAPRLAGGLEALGSPWATAMVILRMREYFPCDTRSTPSSEDFFPDLFCTASWVLAFCFEGLKRKVFSMRCKERVFHPLLETTNYR